MSRMKNSGIQWIGEIPDDWHIVRVKNIFKSKKEVVGDKADEYERLSLTLNGVLKRSKDANDGLQPEEFKGYQVLYENELVFKLIDLENIKTSRVGLSPFTGIVSPAYITLNNEEHTKYGYYFFLSMWQRNIFNALTGDGVRGNLSAKDLLNLEYPSVPLNNQEAIVSYLDQKVAHIDTIIEKTKESIEEYKKLKQSIITETVTKGLNPDIKMKDSGIEWIGDIPEHWKILRGKNTLKILSKPIYETDEVITCFRDGDVTLRKNRREDGFTMADKEIGYQGIDVGDLVIHGMDGFAGAIGISDSRGKATPVLNVCDSWNDKKFIMYYLRSMAYSNVFLAISTGIRIRSCDLSWNKLANLPFPIPPISEQILIVKYIDEKLKMINDFLIIKNKLIEELESYKKSLIYEVVTGKKR